MSTRSNILITDNCEWGTKMVQIYRHCDGYPEGVLADLPEVLKYAWGLPRFEAEDFGAAIVRAWKGRGGGYIYIDPSPTKKNMWKYVHGDVEWVYVIRQENEELMVDIYDWWGQRKSRTKKVWKTIKFSDCAKVAEQINKEGR